jgi:hypothetical protein
MSGQAGPFDSYRNEASRFCFLLTALRCPVAVVPGEQLHIFLTNTLAFKIESGASDPAAIFCVDFEGYGCWCAI